jgi:DNA-binding NarL/FixJ family response regulator
MGTQDPITLVLADDHRIVREGVKALCSFRPDLKILAQSSDGSEAVDLILALHPDFAVLSLHVGKVSGFEVIRRVREARCETRLIVLAVIRDKTVIEELFNNGADGYLLKDGPAGQLFEAIDCIREGGRYLTPLIERESIDAQNATKDPFTLLSKREHEVFSFLVDGMRARDIANVLKISPKTVDTHRKNIVRKLNVEGVAGLVRFSIRRNRRTNSNGG